MNEEVTLDNVNACMDDFIKQIHALQEENNALKEENLALEEENDFLQNEIFNLKSQLHWDSISG